MQLQELTYPTNYVMLWCAIVIIIVQFLFGQDKSFIRDIFLFRKKKEEKELEIEHEKITKCEEKIQNLETIISALQSEAKDCNKEISLLHTTITTQGNTIDKYQNILQLIEKYIKKTNPDDDFSKNFFDILKDIDN